MIETWGPLEYAILGAVIMAIVLAVGWYLSYTAVRLDRLHHRVMGTAAALDAQLVRRAEAALEVAYIAGIDPPLPRCSPPRRGRRWTTRSRGPRHGWTPSRS